MSFSTSCPKCGTNWPEDKPLPVRECPECGVVFARFRAEQAEQQRQAEVQAKIAAKEEMRKAALATKAERRAAAARVEPPNTSVNLVACSACGGQVARVAKTCPHCGAPGPKKTRSPIVTFGLVFFGLLVIVGTVSQRGESQSQPVAFQDTKDKRDLAQTAIRLGGYRCDEVDALTPLLTKPGVRINCNGHRYTYLLVDEGGTWKVHLD